MNIASLIELLVENKRYVTGVFSCVLLAFIASFVFFSKKGDRHAEAYASFLEQVETFEQKEAMDDALYSSLIDTLRKFPTVRSEIEERLAQKLLEIGEGQRAAALAERALARVVDDAPSFAQFGKATLLIEQGEYEEALARSNRLYEELPQDTTLALYTLMRKASLEAVLGQKTEEQKTWATLKALLERPSGSTKAFISHFTTSDISLSDYIHYRAARLR